MPLLGGFSRLSTASNTLVNYDVGEYTMATKRLELYEQAERELGSGARAIDRRMDDVYEVTYPRTPFISLLNGGWLWLFSVSSSSQL